MRTVQLVAVRLASTLTRSTGGALTGKSECERAPWMHLIEDLRSEVRQHLSQAIVELYELSHFEVRSLNLGTCSVICVQMCLNLGISSILKQNNANLQAIIDKSLDDVLPKFRQCAIYLQDFYFTSCILLKILRKI